MSTINYNCGIADLDLYMLLQDAATNQYVIAATAVAEAYNADNEADYKHAASEPGRPGDYLFSISDDLPVGTYKATIELSGVGAIAADVLYYDGESWRQVATDAASAKTAAEAVDTLTKATGNGDLAAMKTAIAALPSAVSIANAVWSASTRTLSSFGTLIASIWAFAQRTLTGSTIGLGPTAARSRSDGYYTCPQGGTVGLYRRILDWSGADLTPADVSTITYSIYLMSGTKQRTAVTGHAAVSLTVADVLFGTVQSDEWASNYNFRHIPDVSVNAAFSAAGSEYLVEYTITPVSGQKIIERFKVKAT